MSESQSRDPIDPGLVEALGHPVRIVVLEELFAGPLSPNMIAVSAKIPLSNVSYHVKVLKECGVIELDHEEPVRGAVEHFYSLVPQAYLGNHRWRKVPASLRSATSAAGFQRFIDVVVAAIKGGNLDVDDATFEWMPLELDPIGVEERGVIMADARRRLLQAHDDSKRRVAQEDTTATTHIVGLAGFEGPGSLRGLGRSKGSRR